jgi:alpha-L-rhamnosidase
LAETFDSMIAHLRHVETLLSTTGLWDKGFQFGDWLDPTAPPERADLAKTDPGVVATASLFRSALITAEVAGILGRHDDALAIQALADRTRAAFNRHYVHDDGLVTSDSQTGYALAIVFGLLDEPAHTRAGERLADLVAGNGYRIATGFAGTSFILDALTISGRLDTAYLLLLERQCPSWLYPVTMGATTIWERWDSMLPDGSINPGGMTSFNHYALGAVADWMHRVIGGISPAEPGYRTIHIAPRPGGGITWAKTSLITSSGELRVAWELDPAGEMVLDITVPDGLTAVVDLPGLPENRYAAGRHQVSGRPATQPARAESLS